MSKTSDAYRLRITGYELIPANKIKPSPHNWRVHIDTQRAALEASMQQIGVVAACIVRKTDKGNYELIDGHLRTDMIGTTQDVPCLVTDLSDIEARKQLVVHDPIAAMAGQDTEMLSRNLQFLKKQDEHHLASHVFPDYILDPLQAADWKPVDKGAMPGRSDGDNMGGHASSNPSIEFTKKELVKVKRAIEKWKSENPDDDEGTDGAVLAKICAYFTS